MEEGERNPAEFSDTHLSQGAEELEMCVCVWERERLNRERENTENLDAVRSAAGFLSV